MELKPHQQKAIDESPNMWGLWFRMRVGKTPTAIGLACTRAKSALVICPKSLTSQWEDEIKKWKHGDCHFFVISRETFRRDWSILPIYEAVIVDEAHQHFSNYKNQAHKSLINYFKKHDIKYIWLLTGTPKPSSSWGVYGYGILLKKGWSWIEWNRKFFINIKMGRRSIPMAKPGMDDELQRIIKSIGTVVDLKDIADISEDNDIVESFVLNQEQKRKIKEFFDPLPIVRYTREHQLEQGVLKSDGYRDTIAFSCDKDTRLLEIVKDTNKIVIVCRYHNQINKIENMLLPLKRNIYKISGREKTIACEVAAIAEADDTAIVICQGDTGVGYSLKSFDTMVFASMSFSIVSYEQVKSRMKSMDKKTPCTYIHLLTEGDSMDKAVYDCIMRKQDFSIELYKK